MVFMYTVYMISRLAKLLVLLLVILTAFFISLAAANVLDEITTADRDNVIKTSDGKTYNLGRCEYLLTSFGWPLTVKKYYTFIAYERPNLEYNFIIDPTQTRDDHIDYVQISPAISDPEFLCNSKSCLFESDNQLIVFAVSLIITAIIYLNYRKVTQR